MRYEIGVIRTRIRSYTIGLLRAASAPRNRCNSNQSTLIHDWVVTFGTTAYSNNGNDKLATAHEENKQQLNDMD